MTKDVARTSGGKINPSSKGGGGAKGGKGSRGGKGGAGGKGDGDKNDAPKPKKARSAYNFYLLKRIAQVCDVMGERWLACLTNYNTTTVLLLIRVLCTINTV